MGREVWQCHGINKGIGVPHHAGDDEVRQGKLMRELHKETNNSQTLSGDHNHGRGIKSSTCGISPFSPSLPFCEKTCEFWFAKLQKQRK